MSHLATGLAVVLACACAVVVAQDHDNAPPPAPVDAAAELAASLAAETAADTAPDTVSAPTAPAPDLGQSFATRHAVFEPRAYTQLPGWSEDDFSGAVDGMRQSCAALRRKAVWQTLCSDFDTAADGGPEVMRAFFERHFYVYQVMSPQRVATGKLTGYFEPLLDGSRVRDARFRYPVYGMPQDLMLLDAGLGDRNSAWLYRDGIRLREGAPGDGRSQEYEIAMDGMNAGVRDKRYRVRVDGRRITPYLSRQQIEQTAIQAPVLAWVDDAHRLYSVQVQGSGKIRLREGGLIRLAYAEQNGHPFRPRVTRGGNADLALAGIKARGLVPGGSAAAGQALRPDPKLPAGVNDEVARMIAALSGSAPPPSTPARPRPAPATPVATTSAAKGPAARPAPAAPARAGSASEINAIIAALKGEAPPPPPRPVGPAGSGPAAAPASSGAPPVASAAPSPHAGGDTGIPDPSYVFFRSMGDGPGGPVGALGVPLSAGRSLAVDPRTTPLGAPVFISSTEPGSSAPMQRLMFAQDTGGAIRGSVRGDFFWGFGDTAGRLALATNNDNMQMWLLLPRQQPIAAVATGGMRLRGSAREQLPECVIADPEFCVEDPVEDD